MSLTVSNYNDNIKKTIDKYKGTIETYTTDLKRINDIIDDLCDVIEEHIDNTPHLRFCLNNTFFQNSLLTQVLPFESYTPDSDNGLLISNSVNCKFTIADIKFMKKAGTKRVFIKVVDYDKQKLPKRTDLLIYDIISAIILEVIIKLPQNRKYRNFIPEYKGCFLSYTSGNWNYNELNYTNSLSPYNENNIKLDGSPYKNESIIMMTEAINNPTSLQIIFKEGFQNQTDENIRRMGIALGATTELYEFIKYIGMKYGFMHNDLHMGNILFNPDTNRLVLIDFGRASFKMLIDRIESSVNNLGMNDFYKLSYDKLFGNVNIDYYVDLYKNKQLYKHHISIGTEGNYFGIIYDLITYTMNIYVYYYYFIKNHAEPEFEEFNNNFSKIIQLHYTSYLRLLGRKIDISCSPDIKTLVENYVQIRDYYIRPLTEPILKNFYIFLLEGLFYTALFMNFMDIPDRRLYVFSNDYFFRAFQITVYDKLPEFKEYIQRELRFYRNELETDTFLSAFIPVLGGRYEQSIVLSKPISKPISKPRIKSNIDIYKVFSIKSKSKSKSPSHKSKVSLEETIEAYSIIYKDKEKLSIPSYET